MPSPNLNRHNQPLALYVHWPFCKAKCPYCDFNSHVREQVEQDTWRAGLVRELQTLAARIEQQAVGSIFFGGGTPSLMPPKTVAAVIETADALFGLETGVEITLEANPTSVEAEKFRGFRAAGVNRVSLGVQSLKPESLAFLGRQHNASEAMAAVGLAAEIFPRYSFDLIYALPSQTPEQWEKELREALAHTRGHMSLYQLTIEENTAFHHAYHTKRAFALPPDEEAVRMYEMTQTIMEEAGLPAYEISNHAAPGQESRHNLAYWQGDAYLGIGPGAHGRVHRDDQRIATATLKSPERWLEAVHAQGHGLETWQVLNEEEWQEEQLLMGLRLAEGIARKDAPFVQEDKIVRLQGLGLLEADPERIRPSLRGKLVLTSLTAELLAS